MTPQAQSKRTRDLKLPLHVTVELDPDVEAVLSFMVENFEARKLVDIANAVKEIALPLWNRHKTEANTCKKRIIPIVLKRYYPPDKDEP
jgi:hypothetical protein